MRFLPSILVAIILAITLLISDDVKLRGLETHQREIAMRLLQRAKMLTHQGLTKSLSTTKNLAVAVGPSLNLTQNEFSDILKRNVVPPLRLIRAEIAPDFIVQMVHPREGSAQYLYRNLLPQSSLISPIREVDIIPPISKFEIIDNQSVLIDLNFQVRELVDNRVVTRGAIQATYQFDIGTTTFNTKAEHRFDHLFYTRKHGDLRPVLPAQWTQKGNMQPIIDRFEYPEGEFVFLVRPLDGWSPLPSDVMRHRLKSLGVAFLLYIPVAIFNWFAVTRISARNLLAASERQMHGMLQNLDGAAYVYISQGGSSFPSPKDKITFLNPEAIRTIWGVDASVFENDILKFWGTGLSPDLIKLFIKNLEPMIAGLTPWHRTYQIVSAQGSIKWIDGRGHPVEMGDGTVHWFCLVFDITEQVERDRELEQQREASFQAQKTKSIGHLTGGVAHDFNNLLAVMMGNLELLEEDETDADKLSMINAALDATRRGADLVRSMLAFARRARLEPVVLDLNAVVREAKSWVGRTLPETIDVKTALLDGIWEISADRSSTDSALLNLIVNARDAMDGRGTLRLETANVYIDKTSNVYTNEEFRNEKLRPGRYVVLAVSDTGQGIPQECRNKIFTPFFTTKEVGEGTGLGLSMVMGFMRQSKGTVQVSSELGHGTTFKLYFPAATKKDAQLTLPPSPSEEILGTGQRILLAEDEESVRNILVETLQRAGYFVTVASNGDQACALFMADSSFDLLLTDIIMPGKLQGVELAVALRKVRPDLPVVFMSGYVDPPTSQQNDTRSEDHRLMKPVHRKELIATLSSALELSRNNGS